MQTKISCFLLSVYKFAANVVIKSESATKILIFSANCFLQDDLRGNILGEIVVSRFGVVVAPLFR